MRRTKARIYEEVSQIYDGLMGDIDYDDWANYILDIFNDTVKNGKDVLELAAGTCKISSVLQKHFSSLVATDISFPMLSYRKLPQINKVCCKMNELPFNNKFDFVYSTFDSVNYLLTKKELLKLFLEIKRILKGNGIYTFDVSLEKNSFDFIVPETIEEEYNGIKYKRISKYNVNTRIHKNKFEIIKPDGKKIREIHKQKIHKFETYFDLIEKAGMYVVECLETFTFNNGNSSSERVQFVIKTDRSKC